MRSYFYFQYFKQSNPKSISRSTGSCRRLHRRYFPETSTKSPIECSLNRTTNLSLYCVMRRFAGQSHVVVREALKLRRLTSPNLRADVRECVTPSKPIGNNHLHTGANQIQCRPPCTFLILAIEIILGMLSAGCLHFSYHWIPVESTPTLLWQ